MEWFGKKKFTLETSGKDVKIPLVSSGKDVIIPLVSSVFFRPLSRAWPCSLKEGCGGDVWP